MNDQIGLNSEVENVVGTENSATISNIFEIEEIEVEDGKSLMSMRC